MPARPGNQFTVQVVGEPHAATCSGDAVSFSKTDLGNGKWQVVIEGNDVTCPGPIIIKGASGNTLHTEAVAPCP